MRSFSEHLFYTAPLRNCLFHIEVAVLQPADTVKNYFIGAIQAFYTRTRSSHAKPFIYLKSLKIICEEVNLQQTYKMPTYKVTKKISFTYHPSCILPSFSKNPSQLLLPKRLWNCSVATVSSKYKQNVVLLVIYLFNYNSSKSTSFMMSVAFNFVLVRFSSSKLEFIAIQRLQKHSFFPACVFWYVVRFNEKLTVLHHEYNTFLFYFDICIKLTISATILTLEKW